MFCFSNNGLFKHKSRQRNYCIISKNSLIIPVNHDLIEIIHKGTTSVSINFKTLLKRGCNVVSVSLLKKLFGRHCRIKSDPLQLKEQGPTHSSTHGFPSARCWAGKKKVDTLYILFCLHWGNIPPWKGSGELKESGFFKSHFTLFLYSNYCIDVFSFGTTNNNFSISLMYDIHIRS